MDTLLIVLLVIASVILIVIFLFRSWILKKGHGPLPPMTDAWRAILNEQVEFYKKLDPEEKKSFEDRVTRFLSGIRITGVKTKVEDLDRLLIASSAIIPIFRFPEWEYGNLNEVLVYPDTFSQEFAFEGQGRDTLGMVGYGAMQNVMILSQHELRQNFLNKTGKNNTAIHEFVHLVDKTDGSVDGVPEALLSRQYIIPWLQLIQKEIAGIIADRSDINPYGATNHAEFFAVVAEYFFERPDLLKQKHPELFDLLEKIFKKNEGTPTAQADLDPS